MFRGIAKVSLDERGRLALPGRFREHLSVGDAKKAVVTINPNLDEKCLFVYPVGGWQMIEEELDKRDSTRPQVHSFIRRFVGPATDVDLDKTGRLLVPEELRTHAQLEKEKKVVVVGVINKLEIWAEALWPSALAEGNGSMEGLEGIRL